MKFKTGTLLIYKIFLSSYNPYYFVTKAGRQYKLAWTDYLGEHNQYNKKHVEFVMVELTNIFGD